MHDTDPAIERYLYATHKGENPTIAEADSVSIVSGMCLFGAAGLKCYAMDGSPSILARPGVSATGEQPTVTDIQRDGAQIYVPEAVARLGRSVASLARFAAQKYHKPVSVYVHLPGAEYKLMAEASHAAGQISIDALRKYYALVDAEVADIRDAFSALFREAKLPAPEFGSPLDTVTAKYTPGTLNLSHFERTPFESTAVSIDMASMKAVGYKSEVISYTQAVKPGNLPLFLDDHEEWKIFKYAAEEPGFRGIALYPLPLSISAQSPLFYYNNASSRQTAKAVALWDLQPSSATSV